MKTVLIDYGAGNLHSVEKALLRAGFSLSTSAEPRVAANADVLVLPGQGHFRQVMQAFLRSGFEPVVRRHVEAKKPFLGICVGLQLLMQDSEEAADTPGLGILSGTVKRFPEGLSVPQMGWNQLAVTGQPALLKGISDGAFVYFANSYFVQFNESLPGATTRYGDTTFLSAVSYGPLNATQFHPEKSQAVGLHILDNFRHIAQDYCP